MIKSPNPELTMSTRLYASKRLGAFPELDDHIIHDAAASLSKHRYLAGGMHFCTNLVEARQSVAEMLNVQHSNPATEVHYTPATGWTHPGRKAPLKDEGTTMTTTPAKIKGTPGRKPAIPTPKDIVPFGNWAEAVSKLTTWERDNTKPSTPDAETAWTKQREKLLGNISYHKRATLKKHTQNIVAVQPKKVPQPKAKAVSVFADKPRVINKTDTFVVKLNAAGTASIECAGLAHLDAVLGSMKRNGIL